MFGNNGYNIIKTPYKKNNGPVRTSSSNINKSLENENKSLRAEIAKKDKMLVDCRRQVEYLQKRLSELSRNSNNSSNNNNNYRSSNSNNFHYQRSNSQSNPYERKTNNHEGNRANRMLFGNFDDFTEAFFNEPFAFFNDQIFNTGNRNRTVNHNYNNNYNSNYYNSVPQNTDIESDIIDQLYPNPDNMTYEQLLALEEQVGSVSKGLSKSDINVSLNAYIIIIYRKYQLLTIQNIVIKIATNAQYVNMNITPTKSSTNINVIIYST